MGRHNLDPGLFNESPGSIKVITVELKHNEYEFIRDRAQRESRPLGNVIRQIIQRKMVLSEVDDESGQ